MPMPHPAQRFRGPPWSNLGDERLQAACFRVQGNHLLLSEQNNIRGVDDGEADAAYSNPLSPCRHDAPALPWRVKSVAGANLRQLPQPERQSASIGNSIRQPTTTGNTIEQSASTRNITQQHLPPPHPRIHSITPTPPTNSALPRIPASTAVSQGSTPQANCAPSAPPEEITGAQIITAAFERSQEREDLPFYTGESAGFSGVLELCADGEQPVRRHILMSSRSTPLPTEDLVYLQSKGVFSIPKPETCRALLRAYLRHVHSIMPVIDGKVIASLYTAGQPTGRNLLLLWSVFFAAMSFAEESVWVGENYTSRDEMRNALYSRAKCMFDVSGETDRTILLQSSLLLGFYHSEKDLHTQPWYWSGVAISLCQIIGLHRNPVSPDANSAEDAQRRRMGRRLWWCCFYRDRWLSLTLGRPLRIDLDDCDVRLPEKSDLLENDLELAARDWVVLIQLTKLLGEVLTWKTRSKYRQPEVQQVRDLENDIAKLTFNASECRDSKIATFSLHHLRLHNQALRITFYRPFSKDAMQAFPHDQREAWHEYMRTRADAAAFETNMILEQLARDKLLSFAGPMTPPLLVPAMHIHLSNSASSSPLARRLGMNKLEFCCVILEELQSVFDSASVFRGIFLEAARRIASRATTANRVENLSSHSDVSAPQAGNTHDAVQVPNDDGFNMYDALFGMEDLSSSAGFWSDFEAF
ncbi:hypothetical protein Q7P37_010342 [Cladosporium fusiforme]